VLGLALSVMMIFALLVPVLVGVNVTLMLQLAPGPTLEPQLLVCAKSAGFAPPTMILVILKLAVPLFVSVTVCAALPLPTF
jgi:hypothetical protein